MESLVQSAPAQAATSTPGAAHRRKLPLKCQVRLVSLEALSKPRVEILKALAEYRWLLTRQIHFLVYPPETLVQQTQGDLARLKDFGLIDSFVAFPERGRASPYGWLLCKAGADLLGISYDRHYQRRPNAYQLAHRDDQIELLRQVHLSTGWSLVKPGIYSKAHPMPRLTSQAWLISEVSCRQEEAWAEIYRQAGYDISDLKREIDSRRIIKDFPSQCNDYVAFTGQQDYAVVFVLFPPDASAKTMLSRLDLYQPVALRRKIYLYALFNNQQLVERYQELFKATGWWGVATAAEVGAILQLVPQETRKANNRVLAAAASCS
ncbi:MAG TPA: hypothetical protein VH186_22170 [Chloroflexia bacterium]|nr:hypothetical protein [Chloroflexia bacterium]